MVKRWTHHVTWDGDLNIKATMMALRSDGEYVLATDYAALEAENAKLRAELERRAVPEGWEESLNKSLVLETERAINQRDKFLETGISTSGHGGSHDTCFAAIVRQHIAMLAAYRSAQEGK